MNAKFDTKEWIQVAGLTIASFAVAYFCHVKWGSDWFEVAGFVTGVVGVYLAAKAHILNWPVGLVNVALYTYVFFTARLFADTSLQVIFFVLGVHGWWSWLKGGEGGTEQSVRALKPRQRAIVVASIVLGSAIYIPIITHFKGAYPAIDSILTVTSIVAQVLLNLKFLENWILWIAVDICYLPLYFARNLYPTAILYGIFLALAISGLLNWKGQLATKQQPLPAA